MSWFDTRRAEDAWMRILDKPSQIVLIRDKQALAAQTVRIESDRTSSDVGTDARSARRMTVVFGIRGHNVLPDTDIRRGDRFAWNGVQFEVLDVVYQTGEVQAYAEART